MPITPSKRALDECKKRGWVAQRVEQWNQWAKKSLDLFGCIDIVACVPEVTDRNTSKVITLSEGFLLGIQVTSGSNHAARVAKIHAEPRMKAWADAGGKIEVWSYAKQGKRGERKRWVLRVEEVRL